MMVISFLLVVLPVVQEPLPSFLAFGAILLGVPVYIFLVMETPRKLRPWVIDRISGTLLNLIGIYSDHALSTPRQLHSNTIMHVLLQSMWVKMNAF